MSELKSYLSGRFQKPFSREKIVQLVTDGVLFLAKIKTIPNDQKKPLLLRTINDLIDETDLPDYSKELLHEIVNSIGDILIENLINLGKDSISFIKNKCCLKLINKY